MESRKSVDNLSESVYSLLGLKPYLTATWADSVCNIIKDLSPTPLHSHFHTIQDNLDALNSYLNQLNIQRRQLLNDYLDLKGSIRVLCRVRPITLDQHLGLPIPRCVAALESSKVLLRLTQNNHKTYCFDTVFHEASSQDEVFTEVEPVIKSAMDGYNVCIFAYGQTGSGKTYTMEGSVDCGGIVCRAIEALFKQAMVRNHTFVFSFSMLEIYMGNLKDLLLPRHSMPPSLAIQTDPKGEVEIDKLVAIQVSDLSQAMMLYRFGCSRRSTASTNSNLTSSRSHCMIRITMTCLEAPERRRETNKIWMVDLGGSERVLKTKALGTRLEEGKAINLSLSALGDVINALHRKKTHIPYRNSKLTQVLKDTLGKDSKMLMIVHVSPKEEDLCETICSLNFATRVKSIHLGLEESTEVREQRGIAMDNLEKRMKQMEDECQHVRRQILKLNERSENLTTMVPSSSEHSEASHLSSKVAHLPRFMRPTICSRSRKYQTWENKGNGPFPARSPIKRVVKVKVKEYISKPITDNQTQHSQDTSEWDINMVVFPEAENTNKRIDEFNSIKFLNVEKWLHLHQNEPARTKSLASGRMDRDGDQNRIAKTCDNKVRGHCLTNKNILNQVNPEVDEWAIDKTITHANAFMENDSSSNSTSLSSSTKIVIQPQGYADGEECDKFNLASSFFESDTDIRTFSTSEAESVHQQKEDWPERALYMANTRRTGMCGLLKQKLQALCAIALLGSGFQNLGLGSDFFYGLVL